MSDTEEAEEIKSEIQFKLTQPFKYAHKGQSTDAEFITLVAPSSKERRECSKLKQGFFRALPDTAETSDNSKEEDPTGEEVMVLITMSTKVELDEYLEVAKELFTKGGRAKVDGEEKLTVPLLELMDYDDFVNMVGEYLVGFILRSSLQSLKVN